MEWLKMETWSPYAVGICIGIVCWFTFLLSNTALGCSTPFARITGMIQKIFAPKAVEGNEFYKKTPPIVDWAVMLLIGIVIGGFLSAWLSGTFRFEMVPEFWKTHFGDTPGWRLGTAFIGGIFMGVGSRWSNGCTSGHGISGTLQMALSGWISVIFIFAGGIGCALLLFA